MMKKPTAPVTTAANKADPEPPFAAAAPAADGPDGEPPDKGGDGQQEEATGGWRQVPPLRDVARFVAAAVAAAAESLRPEPAPTPGAMVEEAILNSFFPDRDREPAAIGRARAVFCRPYAGFGDFFPEALAEAFARAARPPRPGRQAVAFAALCRYEALNHVVNLFVSAGQEDVTSDPVRVEAARRLWREGWVAPDSFYPDTSAIAPALTAAAARAPLRLPALQAHLPAAVGGAHCSRRRGGRSAAAEKERRRREWQDGVRWRLGEFDLVVLLARAAEIRAAAGAAAAAGPA